MPLDLVVPDLLPPADAPDAMRALRLPALERWLARAEITRSPHRTLREMLAASFGLPQPAPVAAISLAADGGGREGAWMRSDPVHLRVAQDALTLHDASILAVTRAEADELVAALQSMFAPDGLEFAAPAPERWYVRLPVAEIPSAVPLDEAVGRNFFGMLPRGTGRINWPSVLTEAQMLLAAHPVNARREAEGRAQINSVWFWGAGERPASVTSPYALVAADDAFARGLACLSAARAIPVPVGGLADLDGVAPGGRVLAVLDALTAPLRRGELGAWKAAAEAVDAAWFSGLGDALQRFGSVNLLLPTGGDTCVAHLDPGARWRWFRRGKPLHAHA